MLGAVLSVILAAVLFPLAYAGPAASFMAPAFPFLSGGAGFLAARYAVRAWRAAKGENEGSNTKTLQLILIFLALVADVLVLGFAAFMALMLITGPIVP